MAKKLKQTKKKISSSNERPVGVKILAILGYIGAVFTLIAGIALAVGSSAIASAIALMVPDAAGLSGIGATLFIVLGIVFIGLAILDYFIARGLWNGKNWARIFMIVLCALSAISSLRPFSIVGLALNGLIIWYLGFYQPAVSYFK
jgi:hypothetical protein